MAKSAWLFTSCSLLMSALFAYSASVQLNDHDWYLWFPLYSSACVVNLFHLAIASKPLFRHVAKATLLLGVSLFLKVVMEHVTSGKAALWSLDMSQRMVREKTGSGLVICSMILHLEALDKTLRPPQRHRRHTIPRWVSLGMAALLCFSIGLPLFFFVIQRGEMEFDNIHQ